MSTSHLDRHPFSRSYGVILPSSLTRVLPLILEFSSRLPVSVCGTGTFKLDSGFSRQRGIDYFGTYFSLVFVSQDYAKADLPTFAPYLLKHTFPFV